MTHTVISSATKEVVIGFDRPFVMIGERINPTGRKLLAEEMKNGDFSRVEADAIAQVEAGAHMLDVNAGIPLADEPALLARAVELVQSVTDVPLSIDSSIIDALERGLSVYKGKALVNSVTCEEDRLEAVLPLVKGVIAALKRRGFEHSGIFLVGLNALRLRMTGYLPSLVSGSTPFSGNPVYVLESGRYYDPVWFYDSPLPQRFDPIFAQEQTKGVQANTSKDEDRKSFLATPLFLDADFWINLPVFTDHPTLGVNGALVNATLWNASNTARFFRSPANAPAAVAEMSAIPELRQTWMFSLASLQHYQFVGGPFFNSLYTISEPILWLTRDPVMMDSLARDRINLHRKQEGFENLDEEIRTLEFAETLGVGSTKTKQVRMIPVD